ncbi:hypothetical protein [Bradyrhizobium lablabi]|uniref:hypothetical protein n=1 Tax=Bradyrhizobium lablabi TaxID=722472 RepID=UPI001BA7E436|nr:hypothetical protein [Bradyrhizobium lablabi]MBR0698110.1 hypothetical protein [Bradyrhizobium lablabi]
MLDQRTALGLYSLPTAGAILLAIIIEMTENVMAEHEQPDGWRQWVRNMAEPTASGFTPATDFGPVVFHGDRTPDDAAALLPDAAATRIIALRQIASDLHSAIPTHEEISELRLEVTALKNRLADLKRLLSEGGSPVPATAWQVADVERKVARAEKEFARQIELKETRAVRWNAAGRLHQSVSDWVLRGIPGGCALDVVEDAPVSELMTKADGGRIEAAVERYRMRQRECVAERHRVNSQQWPISMAEAAAREFITRRAEAAAPDLDSAIEHNLPISFATRRLQSQIFNAQPGAVGYGTPEDAIGLICWLFGQELLEKISAGFREIGDDKHALDQRQREELLATIDADDLAAQRAECSLIWAAAARGEIIDFRSTTMPMAVLGVALRTVPRADPPPTSPEHGYNIFGVPG